MKPRITKLFLGLLIVALVGIPMAAYVGEDTGTTMNVGKGCTTFIIGKDATADGSVIMAHQEDYGSNDCMHLVYHPRETHEPGEVIHFAFEDVPQVELTYAYTADQMYDPERLGMPPATFMNGINEYGVTLGSNCFSCKEALLPNDMGLGWPEMCQLVMERCKTAREAVDLFASLIDTYTFNGFEATSCKNLTFVIADANEGWIMEVTNRHWIAKRCPDDGAIFYANQAEIGTDWDLIADNLIDYAVEQGWYDPLSGDPFNFREVYCGPYLGRPWNQMRVDRQWELLGPKLGSVTLDDAFAVMRDHYEGTVYYDTPHSRALARPICVHSNHSSEVYHLRSDMPAAIGCVMWITAISPCVSVYTPVYAGNRGATPEEWMVGWNFFDPDSAWWIFEQTQRLVAPRSPDPEFWAATWPHVRARWDQVESSEFRQTAELEGIAMKHWQRGRADLAYELLTKYTYEQLHTNFLKAGALLSWVEAKWKNWK